MKPSRTNRRYASISRRFVAHILDDILQSLIGWGLFFTLGGNLSQLKLPTGGPISLQLSSSLLVSFFYTVGFWKYRDGQTPGKRLMHIRVIREDGQPIDWFTGFIRYIGYWVSGIPLGLGYIWALFGPKKQTWHDQLAKTVVVEADNQKPSGVAVVLGCLLPLVFAIVIIIIITSGTLLGIRSIRQKRHTASSIQQSVKQMKPEVKAHYDRSQELFVKMKSAGNNPSTIRNLNDENIAELKKALEIDENNPQLWNQLSSAYTWISTSGRLEDGLAAAGKAYELDPQNAVYAAQVGDYLNRLGKYDDAILQLQKAIRLNDKYAYSFMLLGSAYKQLGIYDSARDNLQKGIDIYTKYNENGQYDEEILAAKKELSSIPK